MGIRERDHSVHESRSQAGCDGARLGCLPARAPSPTPRNRSCGGDDRAASFRVWRRHAHPGRVAGCSRSYPGSADAQSENQGGNRASCPKTSPSRVHLINTRSPQPAWLRASWRSGRRDSNSGPLVPQTSALTRLRHAPRPRHPSGDTESDALPLPHRASVEWRTSIGEGIDAGSPSRLEHESTDGHGRRSVCLRIAREARPSHAHGLGRRHRQSYAHHRHARRRVAGCRNQCFRANAGPRADDAPGWSSCQSAGET